MYNKHYMHSMPKSVIQISHCMHRADTESGHEFNNEATQCQEVNMPKAEQANNSKNIK